MSCGCGGSGVESRTRTVWGTKSTTVGQFVPFFEGKTADVKALKVDALLEQGCNYGSFQVMVKVSQDGLTYSGDDIVLAGSTEGWHYGDAYHSVPRDYRYWQLGVYLINATTDNAGSARIELVLSKSATMDLVLGDRADNQIVRWSGESGIQGSSASISDEGNLTVENGSSGASEILTVRFTAESTPDADQYYFAMYDDTGLVGGIRGSGTADQWELSGTSAVTMAADIAGAGRSFVYVGAYYNVIAQCVSGAAIQFMEDGTEVGRYDGGDSRWYFSHDVRLASGDQVQFGGSTTYIDGVHNGDLTLASGQHVEIGCGSGGDIYFKETGAEVGRYDGGTNAWSFNGVSIDSGGNVQLASGDQIRFGGTTTYIDGVNSGSMDIVSGTTMELSSGNAMTFDSASTITLDAGGSIALDSNSGGVIVQDGGVTWATFDDADRRLTIESTSLSSGELFRADWSADSTLGPSQYYYSCYNSLGLVGGLCGNGESAGLLLQSAGGSLDLEANGGGSIELHHGSSTLMSVKSSGKISLTPGSSEGVEVTKSTTSTSLPYNAFRAINSNASGQRLAYLQFSGIASPTAYQWYLAFRDGGGNAEGRIVGTGAGGISIVYSSDRRRKRNVRRAEALEGKALSAIRQLVQVQWQSAQTDGSDDPWGVGWIAQDVQAVYPRAVTVPSGDDDDQHYGLAPLEFVPLLMEGTQELDAELQRLRDLVTAQAERIARLEDAVERLLGN